MKCAATIFDLAAFARGISAAWFWPKASVVKVKDPYPPGGVIPNQQPDDHLIPMLTASNESARLNRIAALLTGLSVISGVAGNLASRWST